MATVLHIQASPRGQQSAGTQVAHAFLKAYQEAHQADRVETVDVFEADLPVFDAPAAEAKYAVLSGKPPGGAAEARWRQVIEVIERFRGADKLLVSCPMWNFGIPYRLKQYIDLIVQPGLTFKYERNRYVGLVTGRPALLILARGSRYERGSAAEAYDMQRPYLELILRFIGFEDIRAIVVEPTMSEGPEVARERIEAARAEARRLAADL